MLYSIFAGPEYICLTGLCITCDQSRVSVGLCPQPCLPSTVPAFFAKLFSIPVSTLQQTALCERDHSQPADPGRAAGTGMHSELLFPLSCRGGDVVSCLFAPSAALTATESDGTLLMEQYVPCHICAAARPEQSEGGERAEDAQYFNMEDCVLTAIELDYITCPNHPDIPVSLQELVPELFMTDFPAR